MKKLLPIIIFLCALNYKVTAQIGVAYHQSSLAFVGVNYQIGEHFIPEFRIGTNYIFEDVSFELDALYAFLKSDTYQVYAGLGLFNQIQETVVAIPLGINIYPFEQKQFGFHIEIAPIINNTTILRGSWGIRYRFLK